MGADSFGNAPPGVKCVKKLEDAVDSRGFECRVQSGYAFSIIRAAPDANEIKSICQSADCRVLFDAMRAASPTECVTASGWYLYADLVNPVLRQCPSFTTPAVTGEAPFNGNASSAITTVTTAPSTTPNARTTGTASPVSAPVATANSNNELIDTSAKLVDTALNRGTIIAIISASVFVLSVVVALVKFLYQRRQHKNGGS